LSGSIRREFTPRLLAPDKRRATALYRRGAEDNGENAEEGREGRERTMRILKLVLRDLFVLLGASAVKRCALGADQELAMVPVVGDEGEA
jgi:hypothetical protein